MTDRWEDYPIAAQEAVLYELYNYARFLTEVSERATINNNELFFLAALQIEAHVATMAAIDLLRNKERLLDSWDTVKPNIKECIIQRLIEYKQKWTNTIIICYEYNLSEREARAIENANATTAAIVKLGYEKSITRKLNNKFVKVNQIGNSDPEFDYIIPAS